MFAEAFVHRDSSLSAHWRITLTALLVNDPATTEQMPAHLASSTAITQAAESRRNLIGMNSFDVPVRRKHDDGHAKSPHPDVSLQQSSH